MAARLSLVCARCRSRSCIDDEALLFWGDYIVIDRPPAWVILCTAIVYFLASIYAVGYMRLLGEESGCSGSMRCLPVSA